MTSGDSGTEEVLWSSVSVDGQWGRDMNKKLERVTYHTCHHLALLISLKDSVDGDVTTRLCLQHLTSGIFTHLFMDYFNWEEPKSALSFTSFC